MEELRTGYYKFKLPWWSYYEIGHLWVDEESCNKPKPMVLSRCGISQGFDNRWIEEHKVTFLNRLDM